MNAPFPTERFLKTVARLGSDNEHERSVAAKQATAILAQAGLTWEQVLRPGLPVAPVVAKPLAGASGVNAVFNDLFSQFFTPGGGFAPAAAPAPKPQATVRRRTASTILQGAAIPSIIQGHAIIRERTEYAPGQHKMILGIVNAEKDEQYDPLVVFKTDTMDLIAETVKNGTPIGGRVTQPNQAGHLPVFMLTWGF